jgi:alpha-galactosidase
MERSHIVIAYVGGGSRNWAIKLMGDLALSEHLSGELRLYDIDAAAAAHNAGLGEAIFARPEAKGSFALKVCQTLRSVLSGADFVIISIEPGPTEARYADLVIPARHGIVQTVGDTTGPGGLLRALRSVPLMAEIGRAVMECCPGARVINYTNPMTLCVAALHDAAPGILAHGCCHEVYAVQERTAAVVAQELGLAAAPLRSEIEIEIAGVNHFTLAASIRYKGEELLPMLRRRALALLGADGAFSDASSAARTRREGEAWFDCDGLVSLEFLLRLGVLGAAGDRHLAEFVPWFLADEATINSYGVPLTPYEWRIAARDAPRPSVAAVAGRPLSPSGEEGVSQIEALLGHRRVKTNINMPNQGQWSDAPLGHVVETNALVEEGRITPLAAGALPPAAAALERLVIAEQALVLEAAKRRDSALALEALLIDPLVRMPPARARAMLGEMLEYAAPWLPGWRGLA